MREKIDTAAVAWEIVAAIVAIIGVIVTVVVGVATYNSRYDSSANAADGFKITYSASNNTGASSLTASAGSVWYGAFQQSGNSNTSYDFYYKKTSAASYSGCIKSLNFTKNGTSGKQGDWRLARSKSSQKYDVKVKRTSNKGTSSVLRVDWAVDSYDSTGI